MVEVRFLKVLELPPVPVPNAVYYVLSPDGTRAAEFVTDQAGEPLPVGPVNDVTRPLPFRHVQDVDARVWTVNHNLGHEPASVTVLSVGRLEILAEVERVSVNQLLVKLAAPARGSVLVL